MASAFLADGKVCFARYREILAGDLPLRGQLRPALTRFLSGMVSAQSGWRADAIYRKPAVGMAAVAGGTRMLVSLA
jgi:hypothetical protein